MRSASATTCALVTMWPSSSITNPDPVAVPPPPGAGTGAEAVCVPTSASMWATPGAAFS